MTDLAGAAVSSPVSKPEKLDLIVETMREMSTHTDPQQMVAAYVARMRKLLGE